MALNFQAGFRGAAAGAVPVAGVSKLLGGSAFVPVTFISAGIGFLNGLFTDEQVEEVGTQRGSTPLRLEDGPSQIILGRAMTQGKLFYACQNQNSLHMGICLSDGQLDHSRRPSGTDIGVNPEAVVIFGKEYALSPDPSNPGALIAPYGPYSSLVRVWPYFSAAGDGGVSLARASAAAKTWTEEYNASRNTRDRDSNFKPIPVIEPWDTGKHKLIGKSWIHVEVIQDAKSTWQRFPDKLGFVCRGIRMRYPSSRWNLTAARRAQLGVQDYEYTESPAAHLYYILTERRGVPAKSIDNESFLRAHEICVQNIHYTFGAGSSLYGYRNISQRFSSNGLVYSNDNLDQVIRELLFACAGRLDIVDGLYTLKVGTYYPPTRYINRDDLIEDGELQTGSGKARSLQGVKMSLAQSREHHWKPTNMNPAVIRGRESEPDQTKDIGRRAFVNDPLAAGRLSHMALDTELNTDRLVIRVKPSESLEGTHYHPGEIVRVFLPELGIIDTDWSTEIIEIGKDKTARLTLAPQVRLENEKDKFVAPPRKEGKQGPVGTSLPEELVDDSELGTGGVEIPE